MRAAGYFRRATRMSQPFNRDPLSDDDIVGLVTNVLSMRQEWLTRMASPPRETYKECGLPSANPSREDYYNLYDREPIAARACEVLPKESWKVIPEIFEDPDPDTLTAFEGAWEDLPKHLSPTKSHFKTKAEQGGTVWEYLRRLDEQCGIGQYAVMLLGVDDGRPLWEPVDGVEEVGTVGSRENPKAKEKAAQADAGSGYQWGWDTWDGAGKTPRKPYQLKLNGMARGREFTLNFAPAKAGPPVAGAGRAVPPKPKPKPLPPPKAPAWESTTPLRYLRVFPELIADITRFEANRSSPRFGQPVEYLLTLNDPRFGEGYGGIGLTTSTVRVHWTRLIHVADNVQACEWAGVPRMQQIYNNLIGLQKMYCGSPEMYWRGAFPGISFETHPQLGGDVVIDREKLKEDTQRYFKGLQRSLTLMGMSAKTLAPQVVDPTPQIKAQIEAICIRLGVPMRVFMGSERGELASGQDDDTWNDRLSQRHKDFCTPKIIIPFVDRLIALGVLPPPAEENGLDVKWPDGAGMSATEKAAVAAQVTTAMAGYVGGGVDALIEPVDYLTKVIGFSDDEARDMVERAAEHGAEKQTQQMEDQQMMIDEGLAPDPVEMAHKELEIKDKAASKMPVGLAKGAKSGKPPVANVFCPTGEGGGVDPRCRAGEDSTGQSARVADLLERAGKITFSDKPTLDENYQPKTLNEWGAIGKNNHVFKFRVDSGDEFYSTFDKVRPLPTGHRVMEYVFMDSGMSTSITRLGGKDALSVFRQASASLVAISKHTDPPAVYFTAAEKSRIKLYDTMVATLGAAVPGYVALSGTRPADGAKVYLMVKKEHEEAGRTYIENIQKYRGT